MPAHADQHMFSNARNTAISGGTFINVRNSVNSGVNGFQILLENVSQGAFHNAAERGDPPRCHPRTRLAIRAEIMEWIKTPDSMRKLILWMYGPAGAGKTAIAQSIAEECERLHLLSASFFFWRSAAGRNDTSQFVATFAYQLSRHIPAIEGHLITAIERDPKIFSRSLATQMRVLVIEPLKLTVPSLPMPMVAIVDGVDECGPNGRAQSELLHQLALIASELQHLPLIFLVTSRPEYDIREVFNEAHLSPLTKVLVLDNSYKPNEDIKLYFGSTFRGIYDKNLRLGCRLPPRWPAENDVNFLVSKASGQFIFASTVTKFIDSPRHDPMERLTTVLRLSNTANETPFAPLDAVYRFILGSVADVGKVLEILTLLVLGSNALYLQVSKMKAAEELLGFDIRRALIDMHALLSVPPPTDNDLPKFHHASFTDFLMDRSRSREYYIDESQGHFNLCRRCLRLIGSSDLPQVSYQLPVLAFVHHFSELNSPAKQVEVVDALACFDLKAALERISNFGRDLYETCWFKFVSCVEEQGGQEDAFTRLQKEFSDFVFGRLDQYPPSLKPYLPVVLSLPQGRSNMFNILLHAISKSAKEMKNLRELDEKLLGISTVIVWDLNRDFPMEVLQDVAKPREYVLNGERSAAFIKTTIKVICARPFEKDDQILFCRRTDDNRLLKDDADSMTQIALWDLDLCWFTNILKKASIDVDLAQSLLEHTVQFRNDIEPMPGRRYIAKASIEYIQKCGISFLEHIHQPDTNECAICTSCKGAVVVENIPSIPTRSLSLPLPLSEIGDADIESILAFADAFETTPYPFTHMLQFSLSSDGALMVAFTGDESPFGYLM